MHIVPKKQSGMALVITLIMLVVILLGAIAMVRSMDTTTLIAGNLAFRQSATYSGDIGIENAMAWLTSANQATLYCGSAEPDAIATCPSGYKSSGGNVEDSPAANESWDTFWLDNLAGSAVTEAEDAAGNTVSWFIHRLCGGSSALTSLGSNCIETPAAASTVGGSKRSSDAQFKSNSQIYYRITVRIAGKKNTVSYVQAIVAL
jgi:Tfp pilus assembly protein PilX